MKNTAIYSFLAGLLAVAGITIAAYWPGLAGPFLLDDGPNLKATVIDRLELDTLVPAVTNNTSGMLPRVVSVLSLALNTWFTGFDAFAFKYVNLMIHLVNGLLLFWLGGRLLSQGADRSGQQRAWLIAGLAATLWLVHPLNLSTVLYIVQRMAQLSMLFTLAALLGYVIGRQRIIRNDTSGLFIIVASLLGFGSLAVLSKENGALLPLFVLLVEFIIFRLETPNHTLRVQLGVLLSLLCVLPVGAGLAWFLTHIDAMLGGYTLRDFTPAERLLTQSRVVVFYIQLILLPRLHMMGLHHDDVPVVHDVDLITSLAIATLAGLVIAGILVRKKAPVLSLGIGWFLVSHLFESTIFNLELVYEHRNYLAAWGLLLPVVYYTVNAIEVTPYRRSRYLPVLLLAMVLAGMTAVRAQTWSHPITLAEVTLRNHPNSARAATDMAELMLELGKPAEARPYFQRAASLKPQEAGALIDELMTWCDNPRLPASVLDEAESRLRHGFVSAYTMNALKSLHDVFLRGACEAADASMLLPLTHAANETAPSRFRILFLHANLLARSGQPDEAEKAYRDAYAAGSKIPLQMRTAALTGLTAVQLQQYKLAAARETLDILRELNASPAVNIDVPLSRLETAITALKQTTVLK